jgi:hypothetical protein
VATNSGEADGAESPWLRPGFLASGCVVVVILALGVYVGISRITDHRADQDDTATVAPTSRSGATQAARSDRCGLPEPATTGAEPIGLDRRHTTWRYSNVTAYPVSAVYGPGRTSEHGFRYCFQHSAGGALFAAANAIAFDNADVSQARAWSEYMVAQGPYRQQQLAGDYVPRDPDLRLQIIGYRILSYTADEALVDIAARASTAQDTMIISCVFDLVWQHGDWHFTTNHPDPVNVVRVGDTTGYSPWGAD